MTKGTAARGLRNLETHGATRQGTATASVQEQEQRRQKKKSLKDKPYEDSPYAEEADDGLEDAGDDERALERPHREDKPLNRWNRDQLLKMR